MEHRYIKTLIIDGKNWIHLFKHFFQTSSLRDESDHLLPCKSNYDNQLCIGFTRIVKISNATYIKASKIVL